MKIIGVYIGLYTLLEWMMMTIVAGDNSEREGNTKSCIGFIYSMWPQYTGHKHEPILSIWVNIQE